MLIGKLICMQLIVAQGLFQSASWKQQVKGWAGGASLVGDKRSRETLSHSRRRGWGPRDEIPVVELCGYAALCQRSRWYRVAKGSYN